MFGHKSFFKSAIFFKKLSIENLSLSKIEHSKSRLLTERSFDYL